MSSDSDLALRATLDYSGVQQGFDTIIGKAGQVQGSLRSSFGSEMSSSFSNIAASMGPVGSTLAAIGPAGIAAGAGIAVVGSAISSSVNVASNFQAAMSGVAAVAGATAPELERMSIAAREAGASSVFSASQAAEAMGFLASSGMSVNDTIATLEPTLTMAAAGGLGLAEAGDLMAGTLAQFNLSAGEATSVADTLAAGAAASNSSVSQLGAAMQNVGPFAANLGMSIYDTTAALGVFANANIKGGEAGTALKSILGSLLSETKTGSAALAEMGLTYEEISPATHSYGEIINTLSENHMSASQAVAIFGKEQASNAMVAVNGAKSYEDLGEKVREVGGAAEMAKTQTDNYKGATEQFNGAVEEAQISIGNLLLPTLTDLTKVLTGLVTLTTETGGFIADFASGTADAIGTALDGGSLAEIDDAFLKALGVDIGDKVGEGVKESDDLAKAPGDAMGSDQAQSAIEDAGEDAAVSFAEAIKKSGMSEDIARYALSGFTDDAALAAINSQETAYNDMYDRVFEYAGKSLRMHMSKGGSGTFYSLFSEDNLLGGGGLYANPIEAFEAITGLPAPEVGSAAYISLMEGAAKADIAEMRQELKRFMEDEEKYISNVIFDPTTAIMDKAEELGSSATQALSDGIVTQAERMEYLGLAQELDTLKRDFPEIFEKLGEESGQALADALRREDFTKALEILGKEAGKKMGEEAGKALADEMTAGMFYGLEGASDQWQDFVNEEGGYIGPTKYYPGYADAKNQAMADAAAINDAYGINGLGSIGQIQVTADISPAETSKQTLIDSIQTANPTMTVNAETTGAMNKVNSLLTYIINSNPWMTVHVQVAAYAGELQNAVDQAVANALASV